MPVESGTPCTARLRHYRPRFELVSVCIAFAVFALAQLAPSAVAHALMPVAVYEDLAGGVEEKNSGKVESLRFFLLGVLDGIEALSAIHVEAGAKPVVCLPQNPRPRLSQIMLAIDRELKRDQAQGVTDPDRPAEKVIMFALARRWPC